MLLAGGDRQEREALQARLQAAPGWALEIAQAADPPTALRCLQESRYDLVFISCAAADDPLPLLERVRQLHPRSGVVVACARPDAKTAVAAMKIGALDYLAEDDLPAMDFGPILRRYAEGRNVINQDMELRQVNQMKNEFIANVSHELRAPLTVILGYARSMQAGALGQVPEAQRKAVDSIAERSAELLDLLNRILRVRESVEGRQLAALKPTDLCELWRTSARKAERDIRRKRLRLESVYPEAPVWVMADAAAFAEVCDNLLSNAVKFSPEGGSIGLMVGASAGRAWATVKDQGAGIAPELMPRIFEDFSAAASQGPARAHGGLGLGLALSKQTVELHSGSIWLDSPGPGQGCVANLSLPLARADSPQTVVGRPAPIKKRRVLIVEDNPDLIDIIRLFVSAISGNLELATAHSGFEALEIIQNQLPHLIIMDIMMPGMDGLELLARLRRLPAGDRIPVLVVTGYTDAADSAREAGAQEVILKPFERNLFVSKVLQLLKQGEPSAPHA